VLIDHQAFQFAGLKSHDPQTIVNNVVGLAKSAKLFGVPTLLTTVLADRGGALLPALQEVFPDQDPLDRTWINAWEDPAVVDWVQQTGRKKIIIAGLWTEICVAHPVLHGLGAGWINAWEDPAVVDWAMTSISSPMPRAAPHARRTRSRFSAWSRRERAR
jgi:nicotinamidase-related amidase